MSTNKQDLLNSAVSASQSQHICLLFDRCDKKKRVRDYTEIFKEMQKGPLHIMSSQENHQSYSQKNEVLYISEYLIVNRNIYTKVRKVQIILQIFIIIDTVNSPEYFLSSANNKIYYLITEAKDKKLVITKADKSHYMVVLTNTLYRFNRALL